MTDSKRAKKAPSKKSSTSSTKSTKAKKQPMKAPGINPATKLPHTDRWRKGLV